MRRFLPLLVLLLLGVGQTPGHAQQADPLSAYDPDYVQQARDGNMTYQIALGHDIALGGTEADLRAALPWLEQAYKQSAAVADSDPLSAANAALELSRVLAGLAEKSNALDLAKVAELRYRAAAELPGGHDQMIMVAVAMEDQAILLQSLSRYGESIPLLKLARVIYGSFGDEQEDAVANAWLNQGVGHEGLKDFDAALDAYSNALDIWRRLHGDDSAQVGYVVNNIGWIRLQQKQYDDAREWLSYANQVLEAREGAFSKNVTIIRINLGLIEVETDNPDAAIKWGMSAMPYIAANRAQTLEHQRWNFEMLSRAFAAKGNSERAIFFGKMAVNAQQEFRATNTVAGAKDMAASQTEWGRLYQRLADLLINEGRISEAQAVLNMAKEEEVFEFLKRDATAKLTETRAVLTNSELADEAKLAALAAAPIAAEQALQEVMAKVDAGTASPEEQDQVFLLQDALQQATDAFDLAVADFVAAAAPEKQATLQAQFDAVGSYQSVLAELKRPTAILQIAALEETTHLFLTLPGVTVHQQVAIPKADLSRMVFDALEAIEAVSPDADAKLAALYTVLFAPVDQALTDSGTEVVMLNLDGFLRYVPFAALRDGKGYLVQRFAFTLYSPAVPTQFQRADRSAAATAGFGVTQAHPGFSALPGVAKELSTIFGSAGVLSGDTELDAAFDERGLKLALLNKPAILHIASHFNLVPGHEDDSFLLLGDGSHLSLEKLRSTRALRFKGVDLLTLSACQTARGGDGAEIDGFGATAQLNGAGAVLASLWPVSDAATPQLMRDFYYGLIDDGLDKAEALRRAQVKMLTGDAAAAQTAERSATALDDAAPPPQAPQGMQHPYFWSAFVLMGNWL